MVEYSEVLDGARCRKIYSHPRYMAICAAPGRKPWGVLHDFSAEDLDASSLTSTEIDFTKQYGWGWFHD